MGFLDDVVGKVKGAGGGEHSALLNEVLGLLQQGLNFLRGNLPKG